MILFFNKSGKDSNIIERPRNVQELEDVNKSTLAVQDECAPEPVSKLLYLILHSDVTHNYYRQG